MNKAKNTTTDADLGVIPGNFGKTSGSASTENYNIFGNHSFDGYGTIAQLKNIWSCDSSDNQVSVPDLVLQSFPGNGIFSRKVFVGGLPPDVTASKPSVISYCIVL
ncbi:unnamed protein product [Brugia pahangi]|uniref:RRM domain-containing protein n=1 Tax=Brugia pahangi TaxID=6280 RepID=A0A0N4TC94_BRUPA|nr:unnamed protein product [Brugia pahangi]